MIVSRRSVSSPCPPYSPLIVDPPYGYHTVNVVVAAAKTGKIGDGKVFVLPVEHAVRIRTEEIGEKAV